MNHNEPISDELLIIWAQKGAVEVLPELVQRWQDVYPGRSPCETLFC